MANLGGAGRAQTVPTPPTGRRIAVYRTYLAAQRAVDYLSDRQFPVQHVTIVGTDLQMVERVTGRLTYGRVAMAGAASGAWFGLFVGLLLSLFAQGTSLAGTVLPAVVIGVGFGILFGVLSYAFTGGRRDFTSTSQVVASQYAVLCAPEQSGLAERLLSELPEDAADRVDPADASWPADGETPRGRHAQSPSPSWQPPQGTPAAGGAPPATRPGPPPGTPSSGPAAPPGSDAPADAAPQVPTGPTYGEMKERERRARLARERGEDPAASPGGDREPGQG
ncbi:YflT domain-containing protein [Thalassiella azotivora]